ncbi:MAG: flagellar export chaperone FliS [Kiloniellaceae bacterium]
MVPATSQRYADECAAARQSRATVMLYDQAIAAMRSATAAIAAGDIGTRCNAVQLATEIVTTLYLHPDLKQGGARADNLSTLYGFILGRLLRINLYNDPEIAEDVIKLLEPLRESWATLDATIAADELPRNISLAANKAGSETATTNGTAPASMQAAGAK